MLQIGVHLPDDVVALGERPGEPRAVGAGQAVLDRPYDQVKPGPRRRLGADEVGRPVGGRVVDDENVEQLVRKARQERGQGLALVVGRHDDDLLHEPTSGSGRATPMRRSTQQTPSVIPIASSSPSVLARRSAIATAVPGPVPILVARNVASVPSRSPSPPGSRGTTKPSNQANA